MKFKNYTIAEMRKNTTVSASIVNRIEWLQAKGIISITARNDGGTFAAYMGSQCITREAVLDVRIAGGKGVTVEKGHCGSDYLKHIVRILSKYADYLKKFQPDCY